MAREVSCNTVSWRKRVLRPLVEPRVGDGPGDVLPEQRQQRDVFIAEGAAGPIIAHFQHAEQIFLPEQGHGHARGGLAAAGRGRRGVLPCHFALLRGPARQAFTQFGPLARIQRRAVGPARLDLQHAVG